MTFPEHGLTPEQNLWLINTGQSESEAISISNRLKDGNEKKFMLAFLIEYISTERVPVHLCGKNICQVVQDQYGSQKLL